MGKHDLVKAVTQKNNENFEKSDTFSIVLQENYY